MAWTTNVFARKAAQPYVEALQQAFIGRVISTPVPFVNSSAELLSTSLENASTMTRNVARATYFELLDRLEKAEKPPKKAAFQSFLVGVRGLEPRASCSQSTCSTR